MFISLNYWWKITECSHQINQISWASRFAGNPKLLSVLILPWPNKKLDCFKTFFFFFFFLKFGVSHGDIWKSGLTISGSGACDGAEGSATAAQQSAGMGNHYCRSSYRKKKEEASGLKDLSYYPQQMPLMSTVWCLPSADLLCRKRGKDLCPMWGPAL